MSDLIERQAAINALNMLFKKQVTQFGYEGYEKADEKTQLVCDGISYSIECVMNLPSAQPEIIRCKDCENLQTDWKPQDSDGYYCAVMDRMMEEDGFCSHAERKENVQ